MREIVIGIEPSFDHDCRLIYKSESGKASTLQVDTGLFMDWNQAPEKWTESGDGLWTGTRKIRLGDAEDARIQQAINQLSFAFPEETAGFDGTTWHVFFLSDQHSLMGKWWPTLPPSVGALVKLLLEYSGCAGYDSHL